MELDLLEEIVCHEIENCDRLAAVWSLASANGGTGSGLVCALADRLDDILGCSAHMMHGMILCGGQREDVTIGSLNATLSLASLLSPERRRTSVVALDSTEARRRLSGRITSNIKPTIDDLNGELCASILRPLINVGFGALDDVASHPNFHLLSASLPPSHLKFPNHLSPLSKDKYINVQNAHNAFSLPPLRRVKRAVVAVGTALSSSCRRHIIDVADARFDAIRCTCEHLSVAPYHGKLQSTNVASLVSTGGSASDLAALSAIATTALSMVTAKAFAHHFEARGLALADIHHAVDALHDFLGSYSALCPLQK
mmetsp:Transcript_23086/g.74306  ORF Transcript_23086/g.74306 Transcript_23086/m.74306 type:complete len:313 (+) Transcript_23086:496-1434(+)|eukprot:CAMPEP_0118893678 /NCGR_PEP_ID=MMETSP1166-20130328/2792_1 /TAXON_ID=1104430 /ORGANISM="Chrysoreinhardia sp, Strain CCMP3193" /LENGTH=312 /DNA_ID=CAMNT_0006832513 /DNA_START=451 /DNA_END=1389 /DNA_ORIENTATION=-